MKLRSLAFVLTAVSLIAVGSFAAACGGDEEATPIEKYFARLDELGAQYEANLQTPEAASEEEDALKVFQENLADSLALFSKFANGVSDLEPPDEIKSQHEELTEAMRALANTWNEYSDEVSNVVSLEELEALVTGGELDTAGARYEQACLVMEQLATDNGVAINLNC